MGYGMSQELAWERRERLIIQRRLEKERISMERSHNILNDEDDRRAKEAAKTLRLRAVREAKEAEERVASQASRPRK